jgi:ribosomal protein S1
VVKVGQQVEVKVLRIDKPRERIGLSLKRVQPDPWSTALDDYKAGELVEAVVTRVSDFGAFTRLRTGVEGLLHVSEMADIRPDHPQSLVAPGDLLLLRVLRVEPERRRIGLSLRQVSEGEWAEWAASYRAKHAAQIAEEVTITETDEGVRIEEEIVAETADGFVIEERITTETADEIVVEDKIVAETADGIIVVDKVSVETPEGIVTETKVAVETSEGIMTEDRIAVETPEGEVVEAVATEIEPPAEEDPKI